MRFVLILQLVALLLTSACHVASSPAGPWSEAELLDFPRPLGYVCHRATSKIVLDGRIDDAAWKEADWTEDFQDIEGTKRPRPSLRTRVKMLWDDEYLYVAAELEEPHLWAKLTKRDSVIFYDPDFEIFLDPNGDRHDYMEFEFNALGTEWDLYLPRSYMDGGPPLTHWDMKGLISRVSLDGTLNDSSDRDRSWSIEVALPWKGMKEEARRKTPPQLGDVFRINFSRVQWTVDVVDGKYVKRKDPKTGKKLREDNWVWSPQGVINMHRPETWGFLQFAGAREEGRRVAFRLPAEFPAKMLLRRVYLAQGAFWKRNGTYAGSLRELGLTPRRVEGQRSALRLTASDLGYLASVEIEGDLVLSIDSRGRFVVHTPRGSSK